MSEIVLVALNTRHTHSSLSLASLQAFWERKPGRPRLSRIDHDLNLGAEALISRLVLLNPGLIAFSTYIWSVIPTLAISGALKAALPETRIILGGPEVSYEAEALMSQNSWIDAIVLGEGEATFECLLERFYAGSSWDGVKGIVHRRGKEIVTELPRDYIDDLNILPSPFRAGLYGKGLGFTYYEASRGCPFRCSYCLSSVLGPLRNFTLDRVLEDLDWFMKSDYVQVRFADRTFNHNSQRAEAIISHILRNNQRTVKFHFELKPDLLQDSIIDLLGEAPEDFFHLEIGVQSTHENALNEVGRVSSVALMAERLIRLRERTRCHIHLDLLAGMPGENFQSFKKTLDDAFSWKSSTIQVGLVKALKGTSLRKRVETGELDVMPFPPYAVVKSKWLSASEVVEIQDIGKLVEGLFNPGRYPVSLRMLVHHIGNGVPSRLYGRLAKFWRESGKPFYSFGPETVMNGLKEFLAWCCGEDSLKRAFEAVVLHEFRMNQKVPSGKQGPLPEIPQPSGKPYLKPAPGVKIFWYEVDPVRFIEDSGAKLEPFTIAPVAYRYQTDLSQSPDTRRLDLPLPERFALGLIDKAGSPSALSEMWNKLHFEPVSEEKFSLIVDKLREKDLLLPISKLNRP